MGEVHNLVHLAGRHRGLTDEEALTHVNNAIDERLAQFLTARERLSHRDDIPAVLVPYLDGMGTWMRGNLDWSSRTPRYRQQQHEAHPAAGGLPQREPVAAGADR